MNDEEFLTQKSLDYENMLSKSPKSTNLILKNKSSAAKSSNNMWTYEGLLGILYDIHVFCKKILSCDSFYHLILSSNGTRNVVERKELFKKVKHIENVIQFRVFSFEFRKSHVENKCW